MGDRGKKAYEAFKDQQAQRSRDRSRKGRDIGPLPKVANPTRKKRCRLKLRQFAETYFADVFYLGWSQDHLEAIAEIERCILQGGCKALAFPRGSGKTSLLMVAVIWALLYGHRSFVAIVCATEPKAIELLKDIRLALEMNELLTADFPEVCFPIQRLDGIANRASGQLLDGERTNISITAKELVLPTIPGFPSSGARVRVAGIEGSIRGMKALRVKTQKAGVKCGKAKGGKEKKAAKKQKPRTSVEIIRPDVVLVDDPQTRDSAKSPEQTRERMAVIRGDVLGLAGPGKKISAFAAVTVIQKGDVADQLLDREKNPHWQGVRIALMKALPTDVKLWEEYSAIRARDYRLHGQLKEATEFYLSNREAMDAGAVPSWSERFDPGEASAVQYAMNLKLMDEAAFQAEYQNAPLAAESNASIELKADDILAKMIEGVPRGIVRATATKLTAFVDVQGQVLFYAVLDFDENFGAHAVEYGTWPEQQRSHFTLRDLTPSFSTVYPNATEDAAIYAALRDLTGKLLSRTWSRDATDAQGNTPGMSISRLMIDSGWKTEVVKQFCRESAHRALILPSKGFGFLPSRKALNEWEMRPGDRKGWNWHHVAATGVVNYDTNAWKSFFARRARMMVGQQGTYTIHRGDPHRHKLYSEHCSSEYAIDVEALGRKVEDWHCRPNRDNHHFDCTIGCFVAAAEQGIKAEGHGSALGQAPKKYRPSTVRR